MRHALLCLALAALTTISSGCDEEPITCTTELRYSVELTVVDAETGEPVEATVTFLVDGEGPSDAEVTSPGKYLLGQEQDGTFEVTISAEGYEAAMPEYEVTADECHVMTVQATIELAPGT